MIKICKTKPNYLQEESTGIFMKFDNGNTISIQWGKGTYGSYRDVKARPETITAEVLISNVDVEGFPIDPIGWCDSDKVAKLIYQASTYSFEDLVENYSGKVVDYN